MAAPFDWPAGVPIKLLRDGYQRKPQDLVHRMAVEAGPPMRRLLDGSAGQAVKGTLSMTPAAGVLFETFRRDTLDRGGARFSWVITDNGRAVVARFASQPKLTRMPNRWRYAVEIECDAPVPSPASLTALAALEGAGPAAWPATVPFRPVRPSYGLTPEDRILRSPPESVQHYSVSTRAEGHVQDLVLHLTQAQLAAFEAWFETAAAFGALDVLFPAVDGGTHRGSFREVYTLTPAALDKWAVTFKVYLEAVR